MSTVPESSTAANCEDYYRRLYEQCKDVLIESLQGDRSGVHNTSHNYVSDFEKWIEVLSGRPESEALKSALREYQYGLLAVVLGQYRQAFMALRVFLELSLGAVYFSAHEVELRIWLKGERDVAWQCLVDPDSGVFAKRFVRAFFADLADDAPQYRALAERVYRECSEYVHGNPMTGQAIPDGLAFSEKLFMDWHAKAASVRLAISFALCARYLATLDGEAQARLEDVVTDELGHIAAVRAVFGGTTEAEDA